MSYSVHRSVIARAAKPPMRRRVTYDGSPVVKALVSAASYSVYRRLVCGTWSEVTGHVDIPLDVTSTVFDELQGWDVDEAGFNVEVLLSSGLPSPFCYWDTVYLVAVTLELVDGVVDGFGWLLRTPSL